MTKSVPTASRFSRVRSDRDQTVTRRWTDADDKIGTQSGINRQETAMTNFSRSCPFITTASRSTGHRPDTVQTTQGIVTILIRYSRICHDIVTIVIRPDKICRSSRMLRDAPNCRECLADLSDHSRITGLCYECIRLRSDNDRTFQIIEDSDPTFSLFVS